MVAFQCCFKLAGRQYMSIIAGAPSGHYFLAINPGISWETSHQKSDLRESELLFRGFQNGAFGDSLQMTRKMTRHTWIFVCRFRTFLAFSGTIFHISKKQFPYEAK
jgi:hypothetical protein